MGTAASAASAGTTATAARWRVEPGTQLGNGQDGMVVGEAAPMRNAVLVRSGICSGEKGGVVVVVCIAYVGGARTHTNRQRHAERHAAGKQRQDKKSHGDCDSAIQNTRWQDLRGRGGRVVRSMDEN